MADTYDTTDANADRTHRIDVQVIRYGVRGPLYRVVHADGEALIESCRCPLHDSCRALLALGITGRLELWRAGKAMFDAACDIQVGAQYTIMESETESVRLVRWSPSPWNAISHRSVEARTATDADPVPCGLPSVKRRFWTRSLRARAARLPTAQNVRMSKCKGHQ
jgi:hypothetical protein